MQSKTDEFIYRDASSEVETCAICQEEIIVDSTVWTIRYCWHTFHKSCIEPWTASTCPTCRHPYSAPDVLQSTHILRKTAAFAITVKIVNNLKLSQFIREHPIIKDIILNYRIDRHRLYNNDINVRNLQTFYDSYVQLRNEMCHLYHHDNCDDVHMLRPIQEMVKKIIQYPKMHQLVIRHM